MTITGRYYWNSLGNKAASTAKVVCTKNKATTSEVETTAAITTTAATTRMTTDG